MHIYCSSALIFFFFFFFWIPFDIQILVYSNFYANEMIIQIPNQLLTYLKYYFTDAEI